VLKDLGLDRDGLFREVTTGIDRSPFSFLVDRKINPNKNIKASR
jgi:hypothetical protein